LYILIVLNIIFIKTYFMNRILLFCCATIIYTSVLAQNQQQAGFYAVPDSIKTIGFITDVSVVAKEDPKRITAFIAVDRNQLGLYKNKSKKEIVWHFSNRQELKAMMQGWPFDWKYSETYKLLLLTTSDSASNTRLCSGYIFFDKENKWKLLATQTFNDTAGIKNIFSININTKKYTANFSNRWLLRSNNTWKALDSQTTKAPVLRPMSNIDSITQQKIEEDILTAKLPKDSVTYKDGIFYQPIKEGSGRQVQLTDTVVVHYKGWLFSNGSVFDETKEKPATFPLNRLIRGWQIGVPQCKVGGKIRLFIPSGSAYGIRTFATDIPPNSTLVFDVEVVEVKEKR
jgi:FKBP-type peptidyl-prolyl cis-trans isomerase FkpA